MSMTTPVSRRAWSVAVYPRYKGRVLLIKHKRLGVWLPPGGECNEGETPAEAAARELREETGLSGDFPRLSSVDGTPRGLIGYEEHVAGSKGMHLNFVFVVDVARDDVVPNDEFSEWKWVDRFDDLDAPPNVGQLGEIALSAGATSQHIAERWMDAFNARNLDALLALYADDAVHVSPKLRAKKPETEGKIRGKAALRAWWAEAFERLPSMRYDVRSFCGDGERVWMEYTRVVEGEAPMEVAEVLDLRAGRIVESRVFHG